MCRFHRKLSLTLQLDNNRFNVVGGLDSGETTPSLVAHIMTISLIDVVIYSRVSRETE